VYTNGDRYTGDWVRGREEGKGATKHCNGDEHVGAYRDGCKDGKGVQTYFDGAVYEGPWRKNKPHGSVSQYNNLLNTYHDADFLSLHYLTSRYFFLLLPIVLRMGKYTYGNGKYRCLVTYDKFI
jgi:hypothetical protein